MARLTDEQIVQIKQSVSLLDIATEQGHQLKKEGNDFVLLCPFHPEKTPSCKITPSKNLFHCFGCGEGGSVIDWVQKTEKLSFRKACEKLLERIGQTVQLDHSFKEGILNPESSPAELMNSVVEFYHQTLKSSPEAQQYLESRGIYHTELIETFKLG
ncbi:MAG: CHC2 zinc finger domain-containing protein, partial [Pseudomonadota bacterium]